MRSLFLRVAALALALLGLALVALSFEKDVMIEVDGEQRRLSTFARTVEQALSQAGLQVSPADRVNPTLDASISPGLKIVLERANPVVIWADGTEYHVISPEVLPANLLSLAGVPFYPGDLLLRGGAIVQTDDPLPPSSFIGLQVRRPVQITLRDGIRVHQLSSTSATLGQALWEAGFRLSTADFLEPPPDTPLAAYARSGLEASLQRSRELFVRTDGQERRVRTTAGTVAGALSETGFALQGLDYSLPAADQPIPANRRVRVVRVREEVLIEELPIPFENEYLPAPELEIDQQQIIETGQYGINARRVRVRYEDGQEVSRQVEGEWLAREPKNRVVGYGTKVIMHVLETPDGPIQYWRAVRMWATSYHPSTTGKTTASGLPLKKGVAAIDRRYIPFFTRMYIPGYGEAVAADVGGEVIGRWIDLGYSDADYVAWHEWVTVYFLWPPPDNIVWIIP